MKTQLLTSKEAAEKLGVSVQAIKLWFGQGVFPNAYKLNPSKRNSPMRIPADDVEKVLQSRRKNGKARS